MTIKKALDHFEFKFTNVWKSTKPDIDAYNTIIDFVEQKHENQFNDNQLFAKLYIYHYSKLLQFYQCTVFDNQPNKDIQEVLEKPIERLIEDFTKIANDQETFIKMKDVGITEAHPRTKSKDQREKETDVFTLEMLKPTMTFEECKDNLTSLINLALNNQ